MADGRISASVHDDNLKKAVSISAAKFPMIRNLGLLTRGFPQYLWSIRSIRRRLRHLEICYNSTSVGIDDVTQAVENEFKGPSQLLGYRATQKKIRKDYGLNLMMLCTDWTQKDSKCVVALKLREERRKGNFTTRGVNWVHSVDSHDKLLGYQNSTFPSAIYGCMDTASRKLLFAKSVDYKF